MKEIRKGTTGRREDRAKILFQGLKDQDLLGGLEGRSKRVISSWAMLMAKYQGRIERLSNWLCR